MGKIKVMIVDDQYIARQLFDRHERANLLFRADSRITNLLFRDFALAAQYDRKPMMD